MQKKSWVKKSDVAVSRPLQILAYSTIPTFPHRGIHSPPKAQIPSNASCKLKHLITFDSLIKMEWIKLFYVYINLENRFQIVIFEKIIFFKSA